MISEILAEHPWVWTLAWQSTLCLTGGLGASLVLRRRAARAHRVLLLAMVAAVLIPALSQVVHRNDWGLFVAERAMPAIDRVAFEAPEVSTVHEPAASIQRTDAAGGAPQVHETALAPWFRRVNCARIAVRMWLVASVALFLRLGLRLLLSRRLVRRSRQCESGQLIDAIRAARAKLSLEGDVSVRRSEEVHSPAVWCWGRRPVLLIPTEVCQDGDGLDWGGIVSHELAHWKRRDHVAGLLAELVTCVVPWQPLTWLACRRLANLSEQACDDWVVASSRATARYARTLLGLTPGIRIGLTPGVVTSRKALPQRIRRILQNSCRDPRSGALWTLAAVVLVGCVSLGIAFAQSRTAQQDAPKQSPSPPITRPVENEQGPEAEPKVQLRLVDPDGKPVVGATVGQYGKTMDESVLGRKVAIGPRPQTSDEQGAVIVERRGVSGADSTVLYAFHQERRLVALLEVSQSGAGEAVEVRMKPACRVHGRLGSESLQRIGWPLTWTFAYLHWGNHRPLSHSSNKQRVEFWLPPGQYELSAYGSARKSAPDAQHLSAKTQENAFTVTVPRGQSELDLGVIDLKPDRLAGMIGKPAPQFAGIKNWKNGKPVKWADLRGQFVLLDFWGYWCGPCVREMPQLMELHDLFADKGLAIIGVHDASVASIEEMDSKTERARQRDWGGRDLPFAIALDGAPKSSEQGAGLQGHGVVTDTYGVTTFPTTVLVDREGKVSGRMNLYDAKEIVAQLLGIDLHDTEERAWRQRFNEVYRLEEGEILKRIAPPFIPERGDYYRNTQKAQAESIPRGPDRFVFHWTGELKRWSTGFGDFDALGSVLNDVLGLKSYEYDAPDWLLEMRLPGDWIIRNDLSQEVKLQALEKLVVREFASRIRFEKRAVECNVIVATGRFVFHPPVGTYENSSVHLYAGQTDRNEGAGGGTANSLGDFLQRLGDRVNMPVIDRTQQAELGRIPYLHHRSSKLEEIEDEQEKARRLRVLLDNLTAQTELQFEVRTEPVDIWFLVEETIRPVRPRGDGSF